MVIAVWIIGGIVVWLVALLLAFALCKSAFDGDEQIRKMDEER